MTRTINRISSPARLLLIGLLLMALAACASAGRPFPSHSVTMIELNETTQEEIRQLFGPPWRIGIEDGLTTWTYGQYKYRLIGEPSTKDLVVRFDKEGVVVSYTYNATAPEDQPR